MRVDGAKIRHKTQPETKPTKLVVSGAVYKVCDAFYGALKLSCLIHHVLGGRNNIGDNSSLSLSTSTTDPITSLSSRSSAPTHTRFYNVSFSYTEDHV